MTDDEFGRQLLKKYGWSEGKGLGKTETGITRPISLATNRDSKGIGFDEKQFDTWWDTAYDQLAGKLKSKPIKAAKTCKPKRVETKQEISGRTGKKRCKEAGRTKSEPKSKKSKEKTSS